MYEKNTKREKKWAFREFFCIFMLMAGFLGIKKFRERKKMMASLLAKDLEVSNSTYNNWEKGKRDPSFGVVQKLFKMGATVEELFGVEYENNMIQNSERYKNLLKDNQRKAFMIEQLENVIAENGSDYAKEYTNMIKAKDKMFRLDKEMKQTGDEAGNKAKMQEYKDALKSYNNSNQQLQELLMQDLEKQMKAGNYSKASQIRATLNLKAAANSWENEYPGLSELDLGIW
jgi:DNA-binding XRE family transcriptional regulator